jgi:hypothetical protein
VQPKIKSISSLQNLERKLTSEQDEKLQLISIESGNIILNYNKYVSFQRKVGSIFENNRMDIKCNQSLSSIYIHTGLSHLQILNNFSVIFVDYEIYFVNQV